MLYGVPRGNAHQHVAEKTAGLVLSLVLQWRCVRKQNPSPHLPSPVLHTLPQRETHRSLKSEGQRFLMGPSKDAQGVPVTQPNSGRNEVATPGGSRHVACLCVFFLHLVGCGMLWTSFLS